MNKKLTLKKEGGQLFFIVISSNTPINQELDKAFGFDGKGICAKKENEEVVIVDYFHNDTIARFQIIALEETDEEVNYKFIEL